LKTSQCVKVQYQNNKILIVKHITLYCVAAHTIKHDVFDDKYFIILVLTV